MEFIRDNILKILGGVLIVIIIIIVISSCSGKTTERAIGYVAMENELQQTAIKYAKRNTSILPKTKENVSKVQMSTLYTEKKMQKITAAEDSNVKCQGYVNIYMNNTSGYKFVPFLKCGKYYQTKTIAEYILNNEEIVTVDDGLYKDGEDYLYRGEYPNNYIKIGERLYRIMNITSDNYLRVVSNEYITESVVWDDRYNSESQREYGINNYTKSRLKKSVEDLFDLENDYITDEEKNVMVKHDICIGKRSKTDGVIEKNHECDETLNDVYVSLPVVEDYFRASIDSGCTDITKNECNNYNYFQSMKFRTHTLTASKDDTYSVFSLTKSGYNYRKASYSSYLNIVFYVNNNVIYKEGNGSLENPYIVR